MTKTISLIWRDENYGYISGTIAFRHSVEPFLSDTAFTKLARLFKKHGFEDNYARGAWIAKRKSEDHPVEFTEALQSAGFEVEHHGAVPAILEQQTTPKI